MIERQVDLTTPDGTMPTFLFHPEHDGPHPGRALPDGRPEHPAGAAGHGLPARDRRLLRHAAVPLLPRRPVPGVRLERRGHARPTGADGRRSPRRTSSATPRRCSPTPTMIRPPATGRRGGRVLHERRPGGLASPGPFPTASPRRPRSTAPGWSGTPTTRPTSASTRSGPSCTSPGATTTPRRRPRRSR